MKASIKEIQECMADALKRLIKESLSFDPSTDPYDLEVDKALHPEKYPEGKTKYKDPETGKWKVKAVPTRAQNAALKGKDEVDAEIKQIDADNEKEDSYGDEFQNPDINDINTEDDPKSRALRKKYGLDSRTIEDLSTSELMSLKSNLSNMIRRAGGDDGNVSSNRLFRDVTRALGGREEFFRDYCASIADKDDELAPIPWGYEKTGENIKYSYDGKTYNVPDIKLTKTASNIGRRNVNAWGLNGFDHQQFGWGGYKD